MEEQKRIIEINGVKLEVDLRTAKTVDSYKVGDKVKVLKKSYGGNYDSFPGTIVGFDAFEKRPTIIIAYFERSYSNAEIKFLYLNSESEDVEICPMSGDEAFLEKAEVVRLLDDAISTKQSEIEDLRAKKAYFLKKFGAYFKATAGEKA